jgi:hypothetical protein
MIPLRSAPWRQTILRRSRTLAEIETFAATPRAFKVDVIGGSGLLPFPFHRLAERDQIGRHDEGPRTRRGVGLTETD